MRSRWGRKLRIGRQIIRTDPRGFFFTAPDEPPARAILNTLNDGYGRSLGPAAHTARIISAGFTQAHANTTRIPYEEQLPTRSSLGRRNDS